VAQRGVEMQLCSSKTSALEGVSGQQHAPAALYIRERPGTHCRGGWVGPRADLDGRKNCPKYKDVILYLRQANELLFTLQQFVSHPRNRTSCLSQNFGYFGVCYNTTH